MGEEYAYRYDEPANKIGFGPLKGLDRGDRLYLAHHISDEEIVATDVEERYLGLDWTSGLEERVNAGVRVEGTASGASSLRVTVVRGEDFDPVATWVAKLLAGPNAVTFPWVLDQPPVGNWRYRLVLKTDAGTLTCPAGLVSWFVYRRG